MCITLDYLFFILLLNKLHFFFVVRYNFLKLVLKVFLFSLLSFFNLIDFIFSLIIYFKGLTFPCLLCILNFYFKIFDFCFKSVIENFSYLKSIIFSSRCFWLLSVTMYFISSFLLSNSSIFLSLTLTILNFFESK